MPKTSSSIHWLLTVNPRSQSRSQWTSGGASGHLEESVDDSESVDEGESVDDGGVSGRTEETVDDWESVNDGGVRGRTEETVDDLRSQWTNRGVSGRTEKEDSHVTPKTRDHL
ncbi:Dihydrofolate synthase/folylpolyglutamate synthase [Dissostichus eleginoides]|uniref:Dihydrofolate synthase/folylpolyglutamate synthase n=1 Tax=Dissostichus eleginoides TaxID=100907 RepID=A0AAD9F7H6_DISEL|nr:Dihydrofolate synthase/folylpolyglutamate synthase [Dissostichus eleginoides]